MKFKRDMLESLVQQKDERIGRIAAKQSPGKPDKQLADKAGHELLFAAHDLIGELSLRASNGNANAAAFLFSLARVCNELVWILAKAELSIMAASAGWMMEVPCNLPLLPKRQRETLQAIKKLTQTAWRSQALFKVGERKPYDPDKIANRVAMELVSFIQGWQTQAVHWKEAQGNIAWLCQDKPRRLPLTELSKAMLDLSPYTRNTALRWAKVVWDSVLAMTDGRPEQNEMLRPLGDARRKQHRKLNSQGKPSPGTQDAEVRTRIGERIRQAVVDLAGKP